MEIRKMKNAFVKTKNVKNFVSLMDSLQKLPPNIPKLALVYGEHGLGKTHSIIWWATRNDAVYVRANNEMTQAALMRAIVDELGERPLFTMQDNGRSCHSSTWRTSWAKQSRRNPCKTLFTIKR